MNLFISIIPVDKRTNWITRKSSTLIDHVVTNTPEKIFTIWCFAHWN